VPTLLLTPGLDGANGIANESRQVVRALAGRERPVEVWALDAGEPSWEPPLRGPIVFRSARGSRGRLVLWTLRRLLQRSDRTTVIVTHVQLAPLAAAFSFRGARTVVFLNGVEVWNRLRLRERFALQRAWRLLAISTYTAGRFHAAQPTLAGREVTVCRLGAGSVPSRVRPSSNRGYALIVGRLAADEQYKGHDRLLDVWPDVRAKVPHAVLIVAGEGADRSRLEQAAAARGLTDAIQFTGQVSDEQLASLYAGAALFVMPSVAEGLGLVYLEAMRAGLPCIALHGPADELIDNGETGVILDADDRAGLIDAIVLFLTSPAACARMGAAAAACVASEFSEQAFERRLLKALDREVVEYAADGAAVQAGAR
jgi:phosphatidylinositol alpha-1,6-mannosyltransferase